MKKKSGFTLVELLAVIVILGVLLTLATVNVLGVMNNSKKDVGKFTLNQIEDAAKTYTLDFPGSETLSGKDEIVSNLKEYYPEIESKCDFENEAKVDITDDDDITVTISGITCKE